MVTKIDMSEKDEKIPDFDDSLSCPDCDSLEWVEVGFGLAGGGFGPYTFCTECSRIISKTCEPIDE